MELYNYKRRAKVVVRDLMPYKRQNGLVKAFQERIDLAQTMCEVSRILSCAREEAFA